MRELKTGELKRTIDPNSLSIETTNDVKINGEEFVIIGHDSALQALEVALAIDDIHDNIYVAGDSDIGKTTVIKYFLKQNGAESRQAPNDVCYLYNLNQPDEPLAVCLPAGQGKCLAKDMSDFWDKFTKNLGGEIISPKYKKIIDAAYKGADAAASEQWEKLEQEAEHRGFKLVVSQPGENGESEIDVAPLNKKAAANSSLAEELLQKIGQAAEEREKAYEAANKTVSEFNQALFQGILGKSMAVFDKYDSAELKTILSDIKEFLSRHHILFFSSNIPLHFKFLFDCNLFVDHSETKGMPIVQALDCGFCSMFGYTAKEATSAATFTTDLTQMKAGVFHKGNGGVIILRFDDLFTIEGLYYVWPKIKEIIRSGKIGIPEIKSPELIIKTIHPKEISFKAKIILVGDYWQYELLAHYDDQFQRLFQKKVELDNEAEFNDVSKNGYLKYIAIYSQKNNLLPINKEAVARIIEYGLELNENQQTLSLKFNAIRELIRETNLYARKMNKSVIGIDETDRAIDAKKERSNFIEKKERIFIKNRIIKINTSGAAIGQINGMSVYVLKDCQFAIPSKITAVSFAGKGGLLDIDRIVDMTGPVHNKATFILEAYIKSRYSKYVEVPLSFSLCFEQSYCAHEGDSATLAEALVVLSELAKVPIDQGVFITGSMNQKGEVQAIGAINTKVLGAYKTCKDGGLTSRQKFIMPESNVPELMLDKEVIKAIDEGKFHIYSVSHIDEAIEVAMNMSIAEFNKKVYKELARLKREKMDIKNKKINKE